MSPRMGSFFMSSPTLFRASDFARWCNVDQKTIHNWVDKGLVPAGRTPGRQLRFRAEDVRRVLEDMGAQVPEEVARACGVGT